MDFKTTYSEEVEEFRKEVCDWLSANVPANMEFPPETEELDDKTLAFASLKRLSACGFNPSLLVMPLKNLP